MPREQTRPSMIRRGPGGRLSSPVEAIGDHYEVIVVGSGYGAGVAASRLARAGRQVCVMERGRELRPGEFPQTLSRAVPEMQLDGPDGHVGSRLGLYDFRVNDGLNVVLGCGLGGTSLINANVGLEAEPRVFEAEAWPEEIRADLRGGLRRAYTRAAEMLRPTPYPEGAPGYPRLAKFEALKRSGESLGHTAVYPPLYVTFKDGVNHVGVEQKACTLCGDCMSGCNYGAKNTVLMNYLPDASNHGAEIHTQVEVRHLERREGRWLVHYQVLDTGRESSARPTRCVSADLVVLGAGSLGSTEILLRSRTIGLPLSDRVGERFSGNGDVIGFAYNTDVDLHSVGWGQDPPGRWGPVGPSISGMIDLRNQPRLEEGLVIEEGSFVGALAGVLPKAMALAARLRPHPQTQGLVELVKTAEREADGLLRGAHHGAVEHSQLFLVMAHDLGDGRLRLVDDRLRIDWPGVGRERVFRAIDRALEQATRPLGGVFVRDPLWSRLLNQSLITVHPLGGCAMAEDAGRGVTDHKGRVFSGSAGTAVHEGLYVCDGAVVPVPLGVNPSLTITAIAERTCALMAADRGWKINYRLPSHPPRVPAKALAVTMGIELSERMTGFWSTQACGRGAGEWRRGHDLGQAAGSPLTLDVTVVSDDLEALLSDPGHQARVAGSLEAPDLSSRPLTVKDGVFELLSRKGEGAVATSFRYRMRLESEEGRAYWMEGVRASAVAIDLDALTQAPTLEVTLRNGPGPQSRILGRGVLVMSPADLARLLTTLRIRNSPDPATALAAAARAGRFLAGHLLETLAGEAAEPTVLKPSVAPRVRRTLRVEVPEVHALEAPDGTQLKMTRYRAGDKGPVLLAHGLGVSSRIFTTDTVDACLVEYLCSHGYDTWLVDLRSSIDLQASAGQLNADQIAIQDWPAAVARVRQLTGVDDVQVVAHCLGAATFFMAMLAGLTGVRAAVVSQVGAHMRVPHLAQLKANLHLDWALDSLGIQALSTYADLGDGWRHRVIDGVLRHLPLSTEWTCDDLACHRIGFLYGSSYRHGQLNQTTHQALHELFGIVNTRILAHLAQMIRTGHLVDHRGRDVYLPRVKRLAIPIALLHGEKNDYFLPDSTGETLAWLAAANGRDLYRRDVVPGYGHNDFILGQNASRDTYPLVLEHLGMTSRPRGGVWAFAASDHPEV